MAGRRGVASIALFGLVVLCSLIVSTASARREGIATQAIPRATVKVAQSTFGRILVDARGRSLYLFAQDKPRNISCTADYLGCTDTWPPLLTSGKPRAGPGVNARLLSTVRRTKPAGVQVTYNGHPLYFFADDRKPGDVKGQAFISQWYLISPKGTAIKKK